MAKQTFTTGQVLTAAQQNSLQANDFNQTVSVKTANYSLLAADKGTRIEFNTSGSVTCTVNSGEFDAGDTLIIQNRGAGTATITAGTATVNTSASLALAQYSAGTLYFVSDSAALFFGDAAGISASIVDAKGDLIVGTADNTVGRLAVGTNGYTLVADSGETTGLKWAAPSGASFVGASAYRSTTLSLTADTVVIVTYANESYDTSGFHSTSADTSRMTVPSGKAGKYLCIANMFATGGSSRMIIYPYKNGSNVGGSPNWSYVIDNRGYGNAGAMTGSWVMDLAETDYVEVGLYSATNTATLQESTFQFIYLGA